MFSTNIWTDGIFESYSANPSYSDRKCANSKTCAIFERSESWTNGNTDTSRLIQCNWLNGSATWTVAESQSTTCAEPFQFILITAARYKLNYSALLLVSSTMENRCTIPTCIPHRKWNDHTRNKHTEPNESATTEASSINKSSALAQNIGIRTRSWIIGKILVSKRILVALDKRIQRGRRRTVALFYFHTFIFRQNIRPSFRFQWPFKMLEILYPGAERIFISRNGLNVTSYPPQQSDYNKDFPEREREKREME